MPKMSREVVRLKGQLLRPSSQDLLRTIQAHMMLLLHAQKCERREEDAIKEGSQFECGWSLCPEMRNTLSHLGSCKLGKACAVKHCYTSRVILTHWLRCVKTDCRACSRVRQEPKCRLGYVSRRRLVRLLQL